MDERILKTAKAYIAGATKAGACHIMLEMIITADPPTDPDYGAITDGHCTRCKKPIYSTELYDTILSLTNDVKRAVLLCTDCNTKFRQKFGKDMLPQN